jgi:hypothetical protein
MKYRQSQSFWLTAVNPRLKGSFELPKSGVAAKGRRFRVKSLGLKVGTWIIRYAIRRLALNTQLSTLNSLTITRGQFQQVFLATSLGG